MAWIKIDDGVYAKENENNPEKVVTADELQQEKDELLSAIDEMRKRLVDIPEGISDAGKVVLENHNYQVQDLIDGMQDRISEIDSILNL